MIKNKLRVNYGESVHGKDEINAVLKVLKTSTQMGKNVYNLEKKISKLFSKKYGIMTNSGSSALFLAMECANLNEGDEVITPSLTFSTTVSSIVKNNLVPVFVDVNIDTFCIDENEIERKISKKTKAILAPDLLGNICNWKYIKKLSNKYNLITIQDSADTLGSRINERSAGSYADLSITSFYGSHVINGAGNGGMLCTSNKKILNKSKLLRSWGRSSSLFNNSESIENRFNIKIDNIRYDRKFIFDELGYQLEPSEISAAFALVQLSKLKQNTKIRNAIFKSHQKFFKKYSKYLKLPIQNPTSKTNWLAFPLIVKKNKFFDRTDLQIYLEKKNIQTRVIFTGNILRQPGFKKIKCRGKASEFKNSDIIMKGGLLIGCHHGLKDKHLNYIYKCFDEFMKNKN